MYSLALIHTPARMSTDSFDKTFTKRIKKDTAKINKAFEKIKKESEKRRAKIEKDREDNNKKLSSTFDELLKVLDETARADEEKLQSLFSEDSEETVDIDDFVEADGIVTFKD